MPKLPLYLVDVRDAALAHVKAMEIPHCGKMNIVNIIFILLKEINAICVLQTMIFGYLKLQYMPRNIILTIL